MDFNIANNQTMSSFPGESSFHSPTLLDDAAFSEDSEKEGVVVVGEDLCQSNGCSWWKIYGLGHQSNGCSCEHHEMWRRSCCWWCVVGEEDGD